MIVCTDSFTTGSPGVNLTTRSGEVGATWLKQTGSPGDLVLTDAGRIRGNTQDTDSNYYCSGVTASNEYDVSADFVVFTLIVNHYTTLLGRMLTGEKTDVYVTYNTDRFIVTKEVLGAGVELGSVIAALSPSTTYRVKFQIRSDFLRVFRDGVELLAVATPGDVTGIGRGGASFYADGVAPTTNTTGIHLDNFEVKEIDPLLRTGYQVRQAVKRASFY